MKQIKLRAGRWTVCLDTQKTSDETYPNWIQFRLIRHNGTFWSYRLERKSNMEGNGQCWVFVGYVRRTNELRLIGRDSLTRMCATVLARKFGLTYNRAISVTFPNAKVFNPRGRKGAAPSLMGRNRNKNRNLMREHVASIDFETQMKGRV